MACHEHLGNRRHADGVGAGALQEAYLGQGLVCRSADHGVDALAQRETVLLRDAVRVGAQLGIVTSEDLVKRLVGSAARAK